MLVTERRFRLSILKGAVVKRMLCTILLAFAIPVEKIEPKKSICGKWCKGALAVGAVGVGALVAYKHLPVSKSTANKEILMKSLSQSSEDIPSLGRSLSGQGSNILGGSLPSTVIDIAPVVHQVAPRRSYADVVKGTGRLNN